MTKKKEKQRIQILMDPDEIEMIDRAAASTPIKKTRSEFVRHWLAVGVTHTLSDSRPTPFDNLTLTPEEEVQMQINSDTGYLEGGDHEAGGG